VTAPAPVNITSGTTCALQQAVTVTASGTYNYMFLRLIGIAATTMSRGKTMRFEGPNLCF
jgi:hypothetical protein